MKYNKAITKYQ